MKLTIKTLNLRAFVVEFDENRTVLELKKFLAENTELGIAADKQQLIYAGEILENERVLTSYYIEERRFVVVMCKRSAPAAGDGHKEKVSKPNGSPKKTPKPAEGEDDAKKRAAGEKKSPAKGEAAAKVTPAATKVTPAATKVTPAATKLTPAATKATPAATVEVTPAAATTEVTSAATPEPVVTLPPEDYNEEVTNSLVQQILPLGYPEQDIRRALMATLNDADRAVELLIDGEFFDSPTPSVGPVPGSGNNLQFLRNDPMFLQLRDELRNHPELLESTILRIEKANPAVMNLIRDNHQEFLDLLNGTDEPAADGAGVRMVAGGAPQATIQLSEADHAIIDRFVGMGFSRRDVIEAYIACDRNEEATGDFLCRSFDER